MNEMFEINSLILSCVLIVSFFLTLLIKLLIKPYFKNFIKSPVGPQKIHKGNIPRFGGVSIFITLALTSFLFFFEGELIFLKYLIVSTPIFIFGFLEDVTQSISPKLRILGSVITGIIFILVFNISIKQIGINVIDNFLNIKIISIIFTLMCITYLIQAYNIIDGLNGLSLSTAILNLSLIAYISYQSNLFDITLISIFLTVILLGVFALNFPYGKIFLGDAGAYIIGLFVSISLIILNDKSFEIFAFAIVQIIIYPSYELLRSFSRRALFRKNILKPDKKHLHSILHTLNLMKDPKNPLKANYYTSLQLMFLQIINFIYVINFYQKENVILIGIIVSIIIYEILYKIIIFSIKKEHKRSS